MMKRLGIVLLATVGFAGLAQAADLPTKKAPEPAKKVDCWSSFYAWLSNSATDCPLSAYGFTLYGTLDVNATYLSQGANFNPSADKVNYGLNKSANGSRYMFGYNGLSTSVLGIKMKEDILPYGWSLIGVIEAGINPYSGMLLNGPRSLADQNLRGNGGAFPWQTTNFDSSRAGQWDNSQAYIGVSHPVYGTLTFGRTNSLSNDLTSAYDPVSSTAFSPLGFSCTGYAGFGVTGTCRNTAFTYRLTYQNFRAAAQVGVGGYAWDNSDTGFYQGQLGADFGPLSLDGVVSYAQNAVALSSYAINPWLSPSSIKDVNGEWFIKQAFNGVTGYYNPNDVLKATLSNNFGLQFVGKYKWNTVTFYGGYMYANIGNPSNSEIGGFQTIAGGIFVPAGAVTSTAYLNNGAYVSPAYPYNKILNTFWAGFKWSILSNLDLAMGFYYQSQNDFNFAWNTGKIHGVPYGYASPLACTGSGAWISSSKCAGTTDAISLFLDYRPVKRVDLYAGVMVQNVYGGMANGYGKTYYPFPGNSKIYWTSSTTQSWDPTVGIRVRF